MGNSAKKDVVTIRVINFIAHTIYQRISRRLSMSSIVKSTIHISSNKEELKIRA